MEASPCAIPAACLATRRNSLFGGSPLLQQGELDLPAAGRLQSSVKTHLIFEWALAPGFFLPGATTQTRTQNSQIASDISTC